MNLSIRSPTLNVILRVKTISTRFVEPEDWGNTLCYFQWSIQGHEVGISIGEYDDKQLFCQPVKLRNLYLSVLCNVSSETGKCLRAKAS